MSIATTAPEHQRREDALVIEALADGEAFLRRRVVELEHERDSYKLLVHQLLGFLHLAMKDPDGWPRIARHMRTAQSTMSREAITEMFTAAHSKERAA